ncbi:DNA-3-methyladenine glycosylase [Pedobacter yulinensis]|uniref:Putative 3-methyladenine DNA glycosylase n=1 Tax=Pedobacter yulinensis TaxID=2126353 RepID=A0A2T3HL82_9SPHI|nr:DNA-3-methyladenine glycosylase [Pedobacter yulinensis]PST83205.1 DNA-3-methyladenine glycosylase [Pedobacter yulinensis]
MPDNRKLPADFYLNNNVIKLAVSLLGKVLYTKINEQITAGIIVETEAYNGVTDKASHAYGGRRTNRTEIMYGAGGVSYVYLCYGMHCLFNVVTSGPGEPHAVLVRGIEPLEGLELMMGRRKALVHKPNLTAGPGSAAKALGIDRLLNGQDLTGDHIWIEDHGIRYAENQIVSGPRIGVDYAGEDALLPWRFYVRGNPYVSKPNKG